MPISLPSSTTDPMEVDDPPAQSAADLSPERSIGEELVSFSLI